MERPKNECINGSLTNFLSASPTFDGPHTQLDEPHESQQLSGREDDAEIDGPGGRRREGNGKTVTFSDWNSSAVRSAVPLRRNNNALNNEEGYLRLT